MEYVIYIWDENGMGWDGGPDRVTTVSQGVSVTNEIGLIAIDGCTITFDAHPARLEVPREKCGAIGTMDFSFDKPTFIHLRLKKKNRQNRQCPGVSWTKSGIGVLTREKIRGRLFLE